MAKRRITDIARERGLDPNEVAARLFEAGVAIRGDLVDEAAAARALAGSRPTGAGAKAAAQTAAPVRTATGRKVVAAAPAPAARPSRRPCARRLRRARRPTARPVTRARRGPTAPAPARPDAPRGPRPDGAGARSSAPRR